VGYSGLQLQHLKVVSCEKAFGRMRKAPYILIALTMTASQSLAQQTNANEILTKVAAVYANCRSYYDEGSINGASYGFHNGYFRTTFVRPSHLAFELWSNRDDKDRKTGWVVWKNGDSIKSWVPTNLAPGRSTRKETPLDTALDRLVAPSSGASLIIPPLLVPDLFRTSDLLASMSDVRLAGDDNIDGRETFRLEGKLWGGQELRLWIDKSQYLILRSSRKVIVGGQSLEFTINFKPILNTDISPERLSLKVPGEGVATPRPFNQPALNAPKLAARPEFGWSLTQGATAARAVSKRNNDEGDVVRVDTDLVVTSVLVLDRSGKSVTGLTKDDFVVREDDSLQQVANFSLGTSKDVPRSIVLIIDYSGSQLPYIQTSIEAARMLVDKLNPRDRMAVVTDDVNLLVDFTSDRDLLKSRLDGLRQSALSGTLGASDQYDALMATLTELFDSEDVRPIVIFQTDGDQLESLKGGTPQPYTQLSLPRKHSLADILVATERSRATVYSVVSGVRFFDVPEAELLRRAEVDWQNRANAGRQLAGSGESSSRTETVPREALLEMANRWMRRQMALAALAKFTGAWAEFLEQPNQADEIYNRILNDIDRRYVLGYYPTNRARDGKRRKVHIEVRNHPEYVILGQKSYFAREER
jgi:VWFA-related protein